MINRSQKAITLIALVITIVVLIILAAVAINLSLGNNGIFNRAKTAKEMYTNAQEYEQKEVSKTTNEIDGFVGGNRDAVISLEKLNQLLYPNKSMSLASNFSDATAKQSYTVDRDGWVYVRSARNTSGGWWTIWLNSYIVFEQNSAAGYNGASGYFPVKKGDVIEKAQSHTGFSFTIDLRYYE